MPLLYFTLHSIDSSLIRRRDVIDVHQTAGSHTAEHEQAGRAIQWNLWICMKYVFCIIWIQIFSSYKCFMTQQFSSNRNINSYDVVRKGGIQNLSQTTALLSQLRLCCVRMSSMCCSYLHGFPASSVNGVQSSPSKWGVQCAMLEEVQNICAQHRKSCLLLSHTLKQKQKQLSLNWFILNCRSGFSDAISPSALRLFCVECQ